MRVTITYRVPTEPGAPPTDVQVALNSISAITQIADQGLVQLQQIANEVRANPNAQVSGRIGTLASQLLGTRNRLLTADEWTRATGEPANPTDPTGPLRTYSRTLRGLRKVAEARLESIRVSLAARAASPAGPKVDAVLTVVQSREMRQGRTYARDLQDLLAVTQAEYDLANNLTPERIQARLNEARANLAAILKASYKDDVLPSITALRTAIAQQEVDAKEKLDQIEAALAVLEGLNAQNVQQTLPELLAKLPSLQPNLAGLELVAAQETKRLRDAMTKLEQNIRFEMGKLTEIGQIIEVSRQARTAILSPGDAKAFEIGNPGDERQPDIMIPLGNGDKVRILVTVRPSDQPNAKPEVVLDQSSRAYKQGWNMLRTLTYNGYGESGTERVNYSPSINFLAKPFGRDAFRNSLASVGFGVSLFPIGVDQDGSGSSQHAAGLVTSLLDD